MRYLICKYCIIGVLLLVLNLASSSYAYDCYGQAPGTLLECSGPLDENRRPYCDTSADLGNPNLVPDGYECRIEPKDDPFDYPVRGECTSQDVCSCYSGWGGFDCRYSSCYGRVYTQDNVCSGHGTCAGPNECRCWTEGDPTETIGTIPWNGDQCEFPTCNGIISTDPDVCNGRAIVTYDGGGNQLTDGCSAPDTCDCNNVGNWGYHGTFCETLKCDGSTTPDNCGGADQGTCVVKSDSNVVGGANKCSCVEGWDHATDGNDQTPCTEPVCFGIRADGVNPCSGNGACVGPNECNCIGNFIGTNCELATCNNIAYNDPDVCNGGRGTCNQGTHQCENCVDGWQNPGGGGNGFCEEKMCNGVVDGPGVCSGHGNCNPLNRKEDDNQCFCDPDYVGVDCSHYYCYEYRDDDTANVCSNHGTCDNPDDCTCAIGWGTDDCSEPICYGDLASSASVCHEHGTCDSPDNCNCDTGYGGNECQFPICDDIRSDQDPCNSRGTCSEPDQCVCDSGYTGFVCEYIRCYDRYSNDPEVCGGHGTCTAPDTCSCTPGTGWVGSNCDVPVCDSLRADDLHVCNSHGNCTAPDTCQCEQPGWSGANCETSICVDGATSCSSHGVCNDENSACVCDTNWTEDDCSKAVCYGLHEDAQNVCNGHGDCVGPDDCDCYDYRYSGDQCDVVGCYNIEGISPNVCGGDNGTCVAVDTCECRTDVGYVNTKCENPGCFGAGADANLVCSGHGECVAADDCVCENGWGGADCSEPRCNNLPPSDPDSCSTHGECVAANTCECDSEYSGDICQHAICYGVPGDDPYVCAGHGDCVAPNDCQCDVGSSYSGFNCERAGCFGIPANDPDVCFGRGDCIAIDTCECEVEAGIGSNCEINVCFGINATNANVCSGRGDCVLPDTCDCETNYGGDECDTVYCYDILATNVSVCSSHGECVDVDTCVCNSTHIGDECEFVICNGQPEPEYCNNHGSCVNGTSCKCDTDYYGPQCDRLYEVCENSYSVGTSDSPCSECLEDSDGQNACSTYVSPKWELSEQRSGGMILTGLYRVQNRPTDEDSLVIDCVKILSPKTYEKIGEFSTCRWEGVNSDSFVIELGEGNTIESSTELQFDMVPYDDDVELFSSSSADSSSTDSPTTPGEDPSDPIPPPDVESSDNFWWIAGVVIPSTLIMIIGICLCCLLLLMCFCLCCALRPRRNRTTDFYADAKNHVKMDEIDNLTKRQEIEARRKRRQQRLQELNKQQQMLEDERLRHYQAKQQNMERDEADHNAQLEQEKAKYGRNSDRFIYEWDPVSRRYVERLLDDDGNQIDQADFTPPRDSRFGTVVQQAMQREGQGVDKLNQQQRAKDTAADDDENISDFLYQYENGILSQSMASQSLGWLQRSRNAINQRKKNTISGLQLNDALTPVTPRNMNEVDDDSETYDDSEDDY